MTLKTSKQKPKYRVTQSAECGICRLVFFAKYRFDIVTKFLIMAHTLHTTCFLSVIFCVVWGLWVVVIPRNGALRQWFIVVTIRDDFCLLKSLFAGINTTVHRYGSNNTYPCVFNMKRRTYPYLLVDFYDASQFEMIYFANLKIEHFNPDPVISLFGNMQIASIYDKWRHMHQLNICKPYRCYIN